MLSRDLKKSFVFICIFAVFLLIFSFFTIAEDTNFVDDSSLNENNEQIGSNENLQNVHINLDEVNEEINEAGQSKIEQETQNNAQLDYLETEQNDENSSVFLELNESDFLTISDETGEENNSAYFSIENVQNFDENDNPDSYEHIDLEEILNDSSSDVKTDLTDENESILFVLYKGSKKEIETESANQDLEIFKEETILDQQNGSWHKEVKVYSNVHHSNPVVIYADVPESEQSLIKVLWEEGNKELDFGFVDKDDNGLVERIYWTVPHLSEQNFDIIFNSTVDPNFNELNLTRISVPNESIFSNSSLQFKYNISYSLPFICNLSIYGQNIVFSYEGEEEEYSLPSTLPNGYYNWKIFCFDEFEFFKNASDEGSFVVNLSYFNNYSPIAIFNTSSRSVLEGQNVLFNIKLNSSSVVPMYYVIDFGDGTTSYQSGVVITNFLTNNVSHTYSVRGNYSSRLFSLINNVQNSIISNVQVNASGLNLTNSTNQNSSNNSSSNNQNSQTNLRDTSSPVVSLISPINNALIENYTVDFVYRVNDNFNISNCSFNLYLYNNSIIGSLVYSNLTKTPEMNKSLITSLQQFDNGDYSWEVECYDGTNNYESSSREFTYSQGSKNASIRLVLVNESEENDIQILIDNINAFLIKQEGLGLEEKEAIETLNIVEDLKSDKRKLIQIRSDLSHNLDYVPSISERESRKKDIFKQLEEIKERIPINVEVKEKREYYKNSASIDMSEAVKEYVKSYSLVLDSSAISSLIERNEKIQNYVKVSSKVKNIVISYNSSVKKLTLVQKEIDIKNDSFDSFIEVIPKEIANSANDLVFRNEIKILKEDPIIEIKKEDLLDGSIIYYINEEISLEDFEKTNSYVFSKSMDNLKLSPVTGFISFIGGGETGFGFYFSWIILAIFVMVIALGSVRGITISKLKKRPNVSKILVLVKKAEEDLSNYDNDLARERYIEAKELYSTLEPREKKIIFSKLVNLQSRIDKRDIIKLFDEFVLCVKDNKKQEALEIYDNINSIYSRMPKKLKIRFYKKIKPYLSRLK